jgi:hypothetical protein
MQALPSPQINVRTTAQLLYNPPTSEGQPWGHYLSTGSSALTEWVRKKSEETKKTGCENRRKKEGAWESRRKVKNGRDRKRSRPYESRSEVGIHNHLNLYKGGRKSGLKVKQETGAACGSRGGRKASGETKMKRNRTLRKTEIRKRIRQTLKEVKKKEKRRRERGDNVFLEKM